MTDHDPNVRFDPVWRRIRRDNYARQLEGAFSDRFHRLDALNNWGALSWLYPHATATKQAHHLGVEKNAGEFLREAERKVHEPSLRLAAHTLHWGHVPLSYTGAEAIYRAAHVRPNVQSVIDGIVDEVLSQGTLRCTDEDHDGHCADAIRSGDRPHQLYRWLAAWILGRSWKRAWKAVQSCTGDINITQEEVKQKTFRTLVCTDDPGFQVLTLCRRADYVPRDLLQCGTAWLTVDLEALWEKNPLNESIAAKEWELLKAARIYLDDRYYGTPRAQLVHTLAARIIAQGLFSKTFTEKSLEDLLSNRAGDSAYDRLLPDYHRKRLRELRDVAKSGRLDQTWDLVATFRRVSLEGDSRLDAEDKLSGRTGSGRLSYPFNSSYSVTIDPETWSRDQPRYAGPGRRYGTVALHYNRTADAGIKAGRVLKLAAVLRGLQGPFMTEDTLDQVLSWLVRGNVVQGSRVVHRAVGALVAGDQRVSAALKQVSELRSVSAIMAHFMVRVRLDRMARGVPASPNERAVFMLRMPWAAVQRKAGRKLCEAGRECALEYAMQNGDQAGAAFEFAVAMDAWLAPEPAVERVIALRPTLLDDRGQPEAEWDVVRLDVLRDGRWTLRAVECALNRNAGKNVQDRKRLEVLRERLQEKFEDLAHFDAQLASIEDGKVRYVDAGRGFRA